MINKKQLDDLLNSALASRVFPGYVAALVTKDEVTTFAGGKYTYESDSQEVTKETLYDVASLTKIVAPMTVLMRMLDKGSVGIDDKVLTYLPEFAVGEFKNQVTIRHLLTYTLDYDLPGGAKSLMKEIPPETLALRMLQLPLKSPPGTSYVYSNITAFIISQLIERVTGEDFYSVVDREVFVPLSMPGATFTPKRSEWELIPPTEVTDDRGVVQGFVHDESTHYLQSGGIRSGAAGLFCSVVDLAAFLSVVVSNGEAKGLPYLSTGVVEGWTTDQFPSLLPTLTPLGWGDFNNEMIQDYSDRFVVKGGFTGCFMIGDLKNHVGFVILSNATYPTRPKDRAEFNKIKQGVLNLILEAAP